MTAEPYNSELEPRLMSYLYYFNIESDYFECHEYLESLWLDSGRPQILQGLIQAAVCLYHLQNGNLRGAYRMWSRGKPRLKAELPTYKNIDLAQFIRDIDEVLSLIPTEMREHTVTPLEIKGLWLPPVKIHFTDESMTSRIQNWIVEPLPEED